MLFSYFHHDQRIWWWKIIISIFFSILDYYYDDFIMSWFWFVHVDCFGDQHAKIISDHIRLKRKYNSNKPDWSMFAYICVIVFKLIHSPGGCRIRTGVLGMEADPFDPWYSIEKKIVNDDDQTIINTYHSWIHSYLR